jgi:hypothetical protein
VTVKPGFRDLKRPERGFSNAFDGAWHHEGARNSVGKSRPPASSARRKPKPDLRRRVQHLAFIRQLTCVACGKAGPSVAAHVRTGTDGGTGMKPSDRYAVPLCAECHAKQHRIGELTFWSALRIDPLNVASRLWVVSADLKAGERTVFRARQQIDLARGMAE